MDPLSIAASTITILGAISTTFKTLKTIKQLPEAFDKVQNDLPLVEGILRSAENRLGDDQNATDEDKNAALQVLRPTFEKAQELHRVFNAMQDECKKDQGAKDWAKLRGVYHKAVRGFKASRVEHLMKDILENMKKLALSQIFKSADQFDIQALEKAIQDLANVEPSLPDSEFLPDGQIAASQDIAEGGFGMQNNIQGGTNTFTQAKYSATGKGHSINYGKD
jgi:hypothetical protein